MSKASEYTRRWREKNPERWKEINRRYRARHFRKHLYGITEDDFNEALDRQGGTCYACPSKKGLCVDHCHQTGRFRGVLCGPCNRALGLLKEDPERISRLIQYLKENANAVRQD